MCEWRALVRAVVVIVGLLPAAGAASVPLDAAVGRDGEIAFVKAEPGLPNAACKSSCGKYPLDLYVIRPDDKASRRLTTNGGYFYDVEVTGTDRPRWSPDGRKLAGGRVVLIDPHDSNGPSRLELWVINADGSGQRRLAVDAATPAWSPDGRKLLFVRGLGEADANPSALEVWVTDADGGKNEHRLARGGFPSWSPNGKQIAYNTIGDTFQMYVMKSDGTAKRRLAAGAFPAWSPDGRRIAYLGDRGSLYVIDSDGGRRHRVTSRAGPFAWSPDGRWIALATFSSRTQPGSLFLISADGRSQRLLLRGVAGTPSWSPDGKGIVVLKRLAGDRSAIDVVRLRGGRVAQLTTGSVLNPVWQP